MSWLRLAGLVVTTTLLLAVVPAAIAAPTLTVTSSCHTTPDGRNWVGVTLSGSGFQPNTYVKNGSFNSLGQFSSGRIVVEADGTIPPSTPTESLAPNLPFSVMYIHEEHGPDLEISPGERLLAIILVPKDLCRNAPVVADKSACKDAGRPLYGFTSRRQCARFVRLIPRVGPFPTASEQCQGGGWRQFGFKNHKQCARFVRAIPAV